MLNNADNFIKMYNNVKEIHLCQIHWRLFW